MPKPKPAYAQGFRDQMVDLVRSGRKPQAKDSLSSKLSGEQ